MKKQKLNFSNDCNSVCNFMQDDDSTILVMKLASIIITLNQAGYGSNQYYADLLGHKYDYKDILLMEYIKNSLANEGVYLPETEDELLKLSEEIKQENSLLSKINGILQSEVDKANKLAKVKGSNRSMHPIKFDGESGYQKDFLSVGETRFCG